MAIQTLPPRKFGFISSEANGCRSRDQLVAGNGSDAIVAGAIVKDDSGTIVQAVATDTTVAGILCEAVSATDADVARTVLIRDAEVTEAVLTFPAGATTSQKTALKSALADLGIICR